MDDQTLENTKAIIGLQKDIEYIKESVDKIMTNHLAHIGADITSLQKQVSSINVDRSEEKPLQRIIYKVIEYSVLLVVAAVFAMLVSRKM